MSRGEHPVRGASHGGGSAVQHVSVDHRRVDVAVSEEFLDGSDVLSIFEQMRSKRVP